MNELEVPVAFFTIHHFNKGRRDYRKLDELMEEGTLEKEPLDDAKPQGGGKKPVGYRLKTLPRHIMP